MPKKKISPPFGYFGSKHRLACKLSQNLPPHNCWIEAFCGSSAVTLAKEPADIEIINDIDRNITNLFIQLRNNSEELIRLIELTPYAAQELIDAREENQFESDLEKARKFLVQAMMAINGVFGKEKGGFSVSHSYSRNGTEARVNRWNNLPQRLEAVVERLKTIRIENKDAVELINEYIDRPATLIYLDPPYYADRTRGYVNDMIDEEFHRKLLSQANKAKCMLFISGYESTLYDSMLTREQGWEKNSFQTITKGVDGIVHKRTELVWTNQQYRDALAENTLPIKLTEEEAKMGKVNPKR